MNKNIDLKNRVVSYTYADISLIEDEVASYLDKNMKVRFYGALFKTNKYVFVGSAIDKFPNSITINGYRIKKPDEKISIQIG